MEISKNDLDAAVTQQILSAEQAQTLWEIWQNQDSHRPKFDLAHFLYYFGALIAIGAMTWFMTKAWEAFGSKGIFVIATSYALCFGLMGRSLWHKNHLRVPGGLLFTLMVCMTPLAAYGLQTWLGYFDPGEYHHLYVFVRGGWIPIEIATIVVAAITLFFIRFPFLTAPIAFALWFISMDVTELLFGHDMDWRDRAWISLWFGLVMIFVAYLIDRRTKEDYAFWLYLFGLLAFWSGLSGTNVDSEPGRFFYCIVNIGLMITSVFLQRRTFMVFGAIGVFIYLNYLAFRVFPNALLFPPVLMIIGIAIIYLGILYQRHAAKLERHILENSPKYIKALLPANR